MVKMDKTDYFKKINFGIFQEDVDNIKEFIEENISSPKERVKFYLDQAKHYEHLTQIDEIREDAEKVMRYFGCMSRRLK